ncbi:PTS sugar transporter subunit IIC, partial [Anaerostipes caccae]|nr:PTS sugar transporter subunit IIC [Anaerostipes caccae]
SITAVAKSVNFAIPKGVATISSICDGANPLSWVLVKAHSVGAVGLIIAVAVAVGLALMNRKRIIKEAKELHADA